jgi:hypothetical protein
MLFQYPNSPHLRRHGPFGYEDYISFKGWLRDEFTFRCVYCLERERWYPSGADAFGVEHVKPEGDCSLRAVQARLRKPRLRVQPLQLKER